MPDEESWDHYFLPQLQRQDHCWDSNLLLLPVGSDSAEGFGELGLTEHLRTLNFWAADQNRAECPDFEPMRLMVPGSPSWLNALWVGKVDGGMGLLGTLKAPLHNSLAHSAKIKIFLLIWIS